MRRTALLLLSLGLVRPDASDAQAAGAPAAVVDSFYQARAAARWRDAAQLLDLESFGAFRTAQVESVRRPQPGMRPITARFFLEQDPKMPRAVAEYQAKKANEQLASPPNWVVYQYARVRSSKELAALPLEEAAARWLEGHDVRWMLHQSIEEQRRHGCRITPSQAQATMDSMVVPVPRILGTVVDSSVAYVLAANWDAAVQTNPRSDSLASGARRTSAWTSVPPPQVTVLRATGGRWRIDHESATDGAVGLAVSTCLGSKPSDVIRARQ